MRVRRTGGSSCVSRARRFTRVPFTKDTVLSGFVRRLVLTDTGSLFISKSFQGLGIGRLAMDLLEKLAVDLFQARVITLDTAAYEVVRTTDGPEWAWVELAGQESRNSLWYKKRGFEAYGVSPLPPGLSACLGRVSCWMLTGQDIVPLFQDPKKPEVKFHAAFLKKTVQTQTPVTVN